MREFDEVRSILDLARRSGFNEVEACIGEFEFKAKLDSTAPPRPEARVLDVDSPSALRTADITATCVGYLRSLGDGVTIGASISSGQVVGKIEALGLSNDVESTIDGEVVEVLASKDQPLQFGQPIIRVKVAS